MHNLQDGARNKFFPFVLNCLLWVDLQCICFMRSFMLLTSFNIEVFSMQMDI
jgi:hypothetical protein